MNTGFEAGGRGTQVNIHRQPMEPKKKGEEMASVLELPEGS